MNNIKVAACCMALVASAGGLQSASSTPDRASLPEAAKWDLTKMYASESEWQSHYAKIEALIKQFPSRKGTVRSAQALLDTLKARDQIGIQIEKLGAYAQMRMDEDMRVSDSQARSQRAMTLAVQWGEAVSWLTPELLAMPEATLREWVQFPSPAGSASTTLNSQLSTLNSPDSQGDLKVYQHYIEDILRLKSHILSAREEELLAMAGKATEAATEAFSLLSNTELRWRTVKNAEGQDVEITSSAFTQAMNSKDRRYRKDAFLALHGSFADVKSTLATTLAGAMQKDWYYAKARNYPSSLHMALDAENLPMSVYDNLVSTINKRSTLLHRYVALKKKALKLDGVHFYDLYVNLVDVPEKNYAYEEGAKLVIQGIKPFGPEYAGIMQKALDSRWIDVYENKGKRSGAYNMGTYLSAPYVLLNYKGTFKDVSTLAHELGHAMQSWFARENQPPVYAGYPMFTAEVASTAAEIVFKQSILDRTTDPRERAFLINQMLEDMRGTIFRQTQFAEFDRLAHTMAEKGEPITAEGVMKICREHYAKYYGPDFVMDPELEVEYLRIPHFYRGYYVYRYADSYCAAAAIAKRIIKEDPAAREQWMKFLKAGNSMYAMDMLKLAGVDMTTPKPIDDAMDLFEQLLTELEKLL